MSATSGREFEVAREQRSAAQLGSFEPNDYSPSAFDALNGYALAVVAIDNNIANAKFRRGWDAQEPVEKPTHRDFL
jgi:hypothetical protein